MLSSILYTCAQVMVQLRNDNIIIIDVHLDFQFRLENMADFVVPYITMENPPNVGNAQLTAPSSSMGKAPASQTEGADFESSLETVVFCTHIIMLLVSNPEHIALGQRQNATCSTVTVYSRYNVHLGTCAQYPNDLHFMLQINQHYAIPPRDSWDINFINIVWHQLEQNPMYIYRREFSMMHAVKCSKKITN